MKNLNLVQHIKPIAFLVLVPVSLLVILVLPGCGTLFTPDTKAIPLHSNPVAAEVTIDGISHGVTPLTLELSNRESHVIQFAKEGYETVSCELDATMNVGIVVLDVLGGLVPLIVDAATGNWKTLQEEACSVELPEE